MMLEKSGARFIWQAEVRDYEVDFQGIVNNANYFHFLDQARAKFLSQRGINIQHYARANMNFVLIKTETSFKKPLKFGDEFSVVSQISRLGRLRFIFTQEILLEPAKALILTSLNTVCCVNAVTGKPVFVKELAALAAAE